MLPARSVAFTQIRLLPGLSAILAIDQIVVPVAVPDPPVALFHQVTLTIPVSSDAKPLGEIVAEPMKHGGVG